MLGPVFDDVLAAARTGAGWACTRLYEDLAGSVTGYVRRLGCREPDDVASEVFLQLFSALDAFEGDEAGFRSWVFTIAHRRAVDALRRAGRQPATATLEHAEVVAGPDAADTDALRADEVRRLGRHLDQLPDVQREVVLLRVVAGLDVAETAEVVGKRPDHVRQLQRRGLRALHAALEVEGRR